MFFVLEPSIGPWVLVPGRRSSRATCRIVSGADCRSWRRQLGRWPVPGDRLQDSRKPLTLFNTRTPQIYADIDRTKAEKLGVPISRVFNTLSIYMGSAFVNDFNILGRTYRVTAQADNALPPFASRCCQPEGPQRHRRDGADRRGGHLQRIRPDPTECRATIFIRQPRCSFRWRGASPPGKGSRRPRTSPRAACHRD